MHAHEDPAAEQAKQQEQHFQHQRQEVAPQQNPHDGQWVPGDAPSQAPQWAVGAVAKAGTIGVIGVYPPQAHTFPIGETMNKNLTVKAGNCPHRRYVPMLIDMVRAGVIDPVEILTKREPMQQVIQACEAFDKREPGWLKVAVQPMPVAAE